MVGLVAFIGACSDDDIEPDTGTLDGPSVDMPVADAGVETTPQEAGMEGGPQEGGPQESGVDAAVPVSILAGLVEYVGKTSPDGGPVRLAATLASVGKPPTATVKPDFIDGPKPPNCFGYKYSKGSVANSTAWDTGTIKVTGHDKTAKWFDGDTTTTPNPVDLPDPIECTRKLKTGSTTLYEYTCGLPTKTVLPVKSMFTATSKLDISATGGADVPVWSETGIAVGEAPVVTTDLAAIDPKNIEVKWNTTVKAGLVLVNIKAQLADGSEFADIYCSQLALLGSKKFPAGALALLPKTTATNPLIMQTFVAGLAIGGKTVTWGSYTVGGGQGVFGVTVTANP